MKNACRRTTTALLSAAVLALGTAAVHAGTEGRMVQAAHLRIDWPLHGAHDLRAQSAPVAAGRIDWP
ncbi:hypothetical protein FB563_2420 [Streptomyces puniciscabiei]|uniref:Uncharacterized protein n=1 Tax=Streptomyces puniciscabiei TaxID=164348 RepID=A0A542UEF8_9ACTN|nr:hypothetical protein [Streptomyces puniciscabiei]TQK97454.1 hypothetical protein FB563_2420 [Streptomyces puniciscabiei]